MRRSDRCFSPETDSHRQWPPSCGLSLQLEALEGSGWPAQQTIRKYTCRWRESVLPWFRLSLPQAGRSRTWPWCLWTPIGCWREWSLRQRLSPSFRQDLHCSETWRRSRRCSSIPQTHSRKLPFSVPSILARGTFQSVSFMGTVLLFRVDTSKCWTLLRRQEGISGLLSRGLDWWP